MRSLYVLFFVLLTLCSTSHAAISTVAISGDNASGISGAKFDAFTHVTLNSNGQGAFLANLQNSVGGVSSANDQVLYTFTGSNLALRAREGSGGVPNVASANFASFSDVAIADTGDVLLRGSLAVGPGGVATSTDQGLWRLSTGGDALLARKGVGDAPGVVGGQFSSIPNVIRTTENGDLAFDAQLSGGTVTNLNERGLWFYQGSTGNLIVREMISPVPGVPSATFEAFGSPSINNLSQGVAKATMKTAGAITINNRNGVWRYSGATGELLARQGVGMAPGTTGSFGLFGNPVINNSSQVAFRADHATSGEGLWRYGATGELVAIANSVSVPDVPGASFSSFDDPHLADNGTLIVSATMNTGSGGVTTQNASGIWSFAAGSDQLLLRTGSGGVSGVAGANFAMFDELTTNATGSAVVAATLELGPGGVGPANNAGLWFLPTAGSSQLIARTGDQLAGRTIAALSLLSDNFVNRPVRGFNNQNQVLFQADFTNGDAGLFLFGPSGSSTADFNTDTYVDATDLGIWQAAYSSTAGGDADSDGDSDGIDFLTWQRQFTGPGVSASSLTVPEPASLGFLIVLFVLALPCRPSS